MKKKYLVLLSLLVSMTLNVSAQNEKFKALFVYNFTKYIEWPINERTGNFVIGVLGNTSMANELNTIAKKQKVGSQTIVVKVLASVDEIDNCHILYIASGKGSTLPTVIQKLSGKSTLIVTDKEGMINQGAAINFVLDGSKLRYEVSKRNIDKRGLAASSNIYTLGISIN